MREIGRSLPDLTSRLCKMVSGHETACSKLQISNQSALASLSPMMNVKGIIKGWSTMDWHSKQALSIAFIPFLLACSTRANAAPLGFDCDAQPDHFSSVSEDIDGQMMISGAVTLVELRSGKYLPLAGARFVSADGKDSIWFQIAAKTPQAKQLSIIVNTKRGSDVRSGEIGKVDSHDIVPFNFKITNAGQISLEISGVNFKVDSLPIPAGKGMVFCSTAQFKFSNLIFDNNAASDHKNP